MKVHKCNLTEEETESINKRLKHSEETDIVDNVEYYRTCKYGDWLLDHIPYGWRVYYKMSDIRRWFISTYQRIRYGVSDQECWSLDNTLSRFILPRLKHFKKMRRCTYPPDITPEEWENVLDELIWTFEYVLDDGETINPFPSLAKNEDFESYINRDRTEEETKEIEKWKERNEVLEQRKEKGLQLFAKYYQHLWD